MQGIEGHLIVLQADTRGEYLYGPDVAKQFLTQHYNNLDNPERMSTDPAIFAKECTVNLEAATTLRALRPPPKPF